MIAKINDIQVYFKDQGKGDIIILLHGNGENSDIFNYQINRFSEKYRVIAIDTRGHGKSERGIAAFNFNTFATDIIALMNFLSVDSAHFIGFSDGGNLALHIALTAPERVFSLILVGANLFPGGMKASILLQVKALNVWLRFYSLFDKKALKKKEINELMIKYPDISFGQLTFIRKPTLVMAGANDMIKTNHTKEIANAIPGSQLEILPGADHFLLFKKPDVSAKIIEDFLNLRTK